MFLNYLKIAVRGIRRHVSYTLINVTGLALGVTCTMLIFALISYHLSFDNFHRQSEGIYRFVTEQHRDAISYVPSVPPAFGKTFRDDYTYAEKVARKCEVDGLITIDDRGAAKKFKEVVAFVDPEFFDIFNFPRSAQDGAQILAEPNTALISERIAKKYFGTESPLGKLLSFDNRIDFKITGVLEDIPDNTDLRQEIYFSYSTVKQFNEWYAAEDAWGGITSDIQTFARLQPGIDPLDVEKVLPAYVKKYRAESKNVHHYKLQPLNDVHFNPKYNGKMAKSMLWILGVIGFFLVFTACLNFINLATAQALNRMREVGVRKSLGSSRMQLFWQFTSETGMLVIVSCFLAFCVAQGVLPTINEVLQTRVSLYSFPAYQIVGFSIVLIVTVTLLAGFYPGLILSGFKPVSALKGAAGDIKTGSFNIRRALIVTQFTISQVLLIGLIVLVYQMQYVKQTDMGFDQEAVVMIPLGSHDIKTNTVRDQFLSIPDVERVSVCYAAPASNSTWGTSLTYDNRTEAEAFSINFRGGDDHYISTFNIDLAAGRNLTPSDTVREFLVNETFMRKLNISSPEDILGKNLAVKGGEWSGPVVGVVRDFHDQSFRSDINPIYITTSKDDYQVYAVKINMRNTAGTLAALEKSWSAMYPEQIYEYHFLDEQIAEFYSQEETMLKLVQVFAGIALFIGCMGLYGLVSFMSVQRTKEIGIRKVLGGSIAQILWIFGKEFTRLVIIAFFLAAPAGWFLMSNWLEGYSYKVTLTPWIFVLEAAVILVIVLLTVGYQSLKAALRNPVRSLRTE